MSKGYLEEHAPTGPIEDFNTGTVLQEHPEHTSGEPPNTGLAAPLTEHDLPATEELREAFERVSYMDRLRKSIVSTTNTLIVVAAVAILVAMLFLPVLRIYGQSMNATLWSGDLVISLKGSSFETGDVIAFYYNNNILVKRVIATSGQWVDIDLDGNVYVDQKTD